MLPAATRLRRPADFSMTVRRGRRTARGSLVVSLLVADHHDPAAPAALVGFAVGRAVGGSVARHRISRRLRHLMRERLVRLPDGSRLVVRALPGAAGRSRAALSQDLDGALDRLLAAPR